MATNFRLNNTRESCYMNSRKLHVAAESSDYDITDSFFLSLFYA